MYEDRLSALLETLNASANLEVFHDLLADGRQGPDMVALPGGEFHMGCADSLDEQPPHRVSLRPFAISRYPLTFAEYDAYIDSLSQARRDTRCWWPSGLPQPLGARKAPELPLDHGWGRDTRPVIQVNWLEAQAYAEWLGEQTGHHYRLPTEAEWEYAARAGGEQTYLCGDKEVALRDYAWFIDNAGGRSRPVGHKQANAWGLHDMYGNVWEWTASRYQRHYLGEEQRAYVVQTNEELDALPVAVRGGAWLNRAAWLRHGLRYWYPADYRADYLGFRLVRC